MSILQGSEDGTIIARGAYRVRFAGDPRQVAAALALRARSFPADRAGPDAFDARCRHVVVEDLGDGGLAATCRLMPFADARAAVSGYCARYYDLAALAAQGRPMLEIGRVCLAPDRRDPDVLRALWGALARIVDRERFEILFGCASFAGPDPLLHAGAFDLLGRRHLAPADWRIRARDAPSIPLVAAGRSSATARERMAALPPLLRFYLGLGGVVGPDAVIDAEMGSVVIFTALDVAAIPPARRRALREIAAAGDGVDAPPPRA